MLETDVKINLKPLEGVLYNVELALNGNRPPLSKVFGLWARMYRSEMHERFDRHSKGGGDWVPLAESTIRRRRHGKGGAYQRGKRAYEKAVATGGGQVSILQDTGTLISTLTPAFGKPGQYEQLIPNGIQVGIDGPAMHKKGKATIAEIASIHQSGGGNVPKREIFVPPSDDLASKMVDVMASAIGNMVKKSGLSANE